MDYLIDCDHCGELGYVSTRFGNERWQIEVAMREPLVYCGMCRGDQPWILAPAEERAQRRWAHAHLWRGAKIDLDIPA